MVRNLVIADRTGEIPVVIWGEKAEEHLAVGDTLEVYNVSARKGRYGDLEVHVSWGSALVILAKEEVEVEVEGTIIPTRQGTALETANACYLLAEPLPVGYLVRARGTVYRGVIQISHLESITPDRDALQSRLDRLNEKP